MTSDAAEYKSAPQRCCQLLPALAPYAPSIYPPHPTPPYTHIIMSGGGLLDQGKQATRGNEDYVDKGLDAVEKKEGIPENRGINEKITDGARNEFENLTGDNVSSKISN
ncbi:hypothetical protein MVEN_02169200 [Mycena venus]|uniref:Uncharacterized protein n=1 Tax=Mycena venus TaxID=2733690 RepID=A0A8H6X936_9AGAR|nr:hypothetical protein MVEN_02169200 [Mycena venus]